MANATVAPTERRASGAATDLPFCCPLCKGGLEAMPERYRCPACDRIYPVVLGIPDFRVFPDPYIAYADDHAKGRRLAEETAGLDLARSVEHYWAITPDVPRDLVRRYVRHALGTVERGRTTLATLGREGGALRGASGAAMSATEVAPRHEQSPTLRSARAEIVARQTREATDRALGSRRRATSLIVGATSVAGRYASDLSDAPLGRPPASGGAFLEIGCGTGGFLIAAAQQQEHDAVVGVDIAFRWLVLARKRVEEAVRTGALTPAAAARIRIVCCCGEHLPFPDGRFAAVVASDVIAHTARQAAFLRQSRRALRPGGLLFLASPNRYSLLPEPHVRVWGVGFLPRPLMGPYVRLVKRTGYEHIRLLSVPELTSMLRRAGFARWRLLPPQFGAAELARYGRRERLAVGLYRHLARLPGLRQALVLVGPMYQAVAVAPDAAAQS